jgi:hypothetical protein
MSNPVQFTGTAKAWTTGKWRDIESVLHTVKGGEVDQAVSDMTYTNHDMSATEEWVEVGVATITVTLHPREVLFERELEGLNAQLAKVRADNHMRENAILDRISKLQAIEYFGDES